MVSKNQKSRREFLCRDYLWIVFGDMANDFGCSRDFLLNEAMRQFAAQKGYLTDDRIAALERDTAPPDASITESPGNARLTPPPLPAQAIPSPLFMFFGGKKYTIHPTEEFVIGRGTKGTHLTIKDGNISRRHAGIFFRDGDYVIRDLGSTNGIEFKEQRVESKKVEEGDVFYLCDYEIKFTFHATRS